MDVPQQAQQFEIEDGDLTVVLNKTRLIAAIAFSFAFLIASAISAFQIYLAIISSRGLSLTIISPEQTNACDGGLKRFLHLTRSTSILLAVTLPIFTVAVAMAICCSIRQFKPENRGGVAEFIASLVSAICIGWVIVAGEVMSIVSAVTGEQFCFPQVHLVSSLSLLLCAI